MIGGRLKAITDAVRIEADSRVILAIRACAESAAVGRSAKGFSFATMKPALGSLTASIRE